MAMQRREVQEKAPWEVLGRELGREKIGGSRTAKSQEGTFTRRRGPVARRALKRSSRIKNETAPLLAMSTGVALKAHFSSTGRRPSGGGRFEEERCGGWCPSVDALLEVISGKVRGETG